MSSIFTDQMNDAYEKQKDRIDKSKQKNNGRITKQKPNFELPRFKKGDKIKVIEMSIANTGIECDKTQEATSDNRVLVGQTTYIIRSCSMEGGTYYYAVEVESEKQLIGIYAEHELSRII